MKHIGKVIKRNLVLSLLALSLLSLTGCGEDSSSTKEPVKPYSNAIECNGQKVPVGIKGNTACPYLGQYNAQQGYQGYSVQYSASYGIGFYIDFGWEYNDMCPEVGQLPVFQDGRFDHCSSVNPVFAQTDFKGFTQPNTGECAGDQLDMSITGCRPQLRPSEPLYNW